LKKEIVHNGDVLNTTAHVQATCNEPGHSLLDSAPLLETLNLGPEYRTQSLGPLPLRGRTDPLELYAVERADASPA
jgi:adenylate cyclase